MYQTGTGIIETQHILRLVTYLRQQGPDSRYFVFLDVEDAGTQPLVQACAKIIAARFGGSEIQLRKALRR